MEKEEEIENFRNLQGKGIEKEEEMKNDRNLQGK